MSANDNMQPTCSKWTTDEHIREDKSIEIKQESGSSLPKILEKEKHDLAVIKKTVKFMDESLEKMKIANLAKKMLEISKDKSSTRFPKHPILLREEELKKEKKAAILKETEGKKRGKNDLIDFMQFLGLEEEADKLKNQLYGESNVIEETDDMDLSFVPNENFNNLRGGFSGQLVSWKPMETIHYEKEFNLMGAKAKIFWQVERELQSKSELDKLTKERSKRPPYLPEEEIKKFKDGSIKQEEPYFQMALEVDQPTSLNQLFTGYDLGDDEQSKALFSKKKLKDSQNMNWILDFEPWLEDEEPWKNMEKADKQISQKLIVDNIKSDYKDIDEADKSNLIAEPQVSKDFLSKYKRKKESLQEHVTQLEENLFQKLQDEAEDNITELTRYRKQKSKNKDDDDDDDSELSLIKCCKVFKKNHKCKKMFSKHQRRVKERPEAPSPKEFSEQKNYYLSSQRSLALYRELYDKFKAGEKPKKYTYSTKPIHPLFGRKTVLADKFVKHEKLDFSPHYKDTLKELDAENLIFRYNYFKEAKRDLKRARKVGPVPFKIQPLQKAEVDHSFKVSDYLTEEFYEELQRPIDEIEYVEEQEEEEEESNENDEVCS